MVKWFSMKYQRAITSIGGIKENHDKQQAASRVGTVVQLENVHEVALGAAGVLMMTT